MKFKNLKGKDVKINISKYKIDWDAPERSKFQFRVKKFLEPYWKSHVVLSEFRIVSTLMTFDLYNMTTKVAVEIQGAQHQSFNKFFHNNSKANYLEQLKRDQLKIQFCEMNKITLIEIFPEDEENLSKAWFEERGVFL